MLVLLISTLVFGFIQSLLELTKDDQSSNKKRIKWILSICYILTLAIGVTTIIVQHNDDTSTLNIVRNFNSSVQGLTQNTREQLQALDISLDQTKGLTDDMKQVISTTDSLTNVTSKINQRLLQQIKLSDKSFDERKALLSLASYNLEWQKNSSGSYSLYAWVTNDGQRNAIMKKGFGYVVFFDQHNKAVNDITIPGNSNSETLQPYRSAPQRLAYISQGLFGFDTMKVVAFAIIYLNLTYQDTLDKKDVPAKFYMLYDFAAHDFGSPKDWQIAIMKDWLNSHNIKG